MSLLSVIQTAVGELGLSVPTAVSGIQDTTLQQYMALTNRALMELQDDPMNAGYWEVLRKQYTFTTTGVGPYTCTITPGSAVLTNMSSTTGIVVGYQTYCVGLVNDSIVTNVDAGASTVTVSQVPTGSVTLSGQSVTFAKEAYALPSDYTYMIPQTQWDRSFRWQLLGPLNAQEWQVIKSGISPVGPRMRFRIMGGLLNVNPVGSASTIYTNTLEFEYASNLPVAIAAAPTVGIQQLYQLDSDISLIPEDLITLSLKWRYLRSKGLSYEVEQATYEVKKDRIQGRDKSARSLPLNARASGVRLLNSQNVPDTGFGS